MSADRIGGHCRELIELPLRPTKFDRDILAFDIAGLAQALATQSQPTQFVARIRQLVAALPLPHAMPPTQIGLARRLDATGEICALAKRFHNCLAKYTERVDDGQCAIYLWEDPASPAACQVSRHGRLGWFLNQALGPRNVELEPPQLQRIRSAFAGAGIPEDSVIYAIECILQSDWAMRPGRRGRRPGL
jgi:hypothetical protein